jgi:DNA polymerase-3 subunit delta'
MQFNQVIGQEETKSQLMQMIRQNRLSHALLFLGKEGTGALSLARAFAQYTVCEKVNGKKNEPAGPSLFGDEQTEAGEEPVISDPAFFSDSCGQCAACKKAAQLVHPDIHFSYPVISRKSGDKPISTDYIKEWRDFLASHPYGNTYDWLQFIGAENKQGNITSHECEDILRKMSLKSFESGYKILIMWMPELLGKEGNKLLKLIEEPPPMTLFMLVAENDALILPTILSRTQLIKIPALTHPQVESALEEREHIPAEKARRLSAISGGNYHEALQLLQHADDDWEVLLRDWLNSVLKTGPAAQVKWIEEISKTGREKQKQFLKYFTHLLHHAIRIRAMGIDQAGPSESQSTNDFALRLNKLCTISQQEAIVKELDNAAYYVERNANAKILFHALTIKMYHIISNKSVILME